MNRKQRAILAGRKPKCRKSVSHGQGGVWISWERIGTTPLADELRAVIESVNQQIFASFALPESVFRGAKR